MDDQTQQDLNRQKTAYKHKAFGAFCTGMVTAAAIAFGGYKMADQAPHVRDLDKRRELEAIHRSNIQFLTAQQRRQPESDLLYAPAAKPEERLSADKPEISIKQQFADENAEIKAIQNGERDPLSEIYVFGWVAAFLGAGIIGVRLANHYEQKRADLFEELDDMTETNDLTPPVKSVTPPAGPTV